MNNMATKESWQNVPINNPKSVNISEIAPDLKLFFSEEQYKMLHKGLIPKQMEDKWFIYFENDWLYFHRSWTGNGIFKAKITKEMGEQEDQEYKINEFYVERDKNIYKNDEDIYDLDVLLQLILWGLLNIDVRGFYLKKYCSSQKGTIRAWSEFGRLFFNEKDIDKKEKK